MAKFFCRAKEKGKLSSTTFDQLKLRTWEQSQAAAVERAIENPAEKKENYANFFSATAADLVWKFVRTSPLFPFSQWLPSLPMSAAARCVALCAICWLVWSSLAHSLNLPIIVNISKVSLVWIWKLLKGAPKSVPLICLCLTLCLSRSWLFTQFSNEKQNAHQQQANCHFYHYFCISSTRIWAAKWKMNWNWEKRKKKSQKIPRKNEMWIE